MADKLKQQQPQEQQQSSSFLQVPDNNNNNNLSRRQQQQQLAIQKKHSGPLDEALAELNRQENKEITTATAKTTLTTTTTTVSSDDDNNSCNKLKAKPRRSSLNKDSSTAHHFPHYAHHYPHHHHYHHHHGGGSSSKQRERWLLTRKTWKFMQDAGKKLIPDGIKNTKDDIPLIEEHFQRVCANETRFILWRRKCSYPGALRSSAARLRPIALHRQQQQQQQNKLLILPKGLEETADQTIELLRNYLQYIDEAAGGGGGSHATTALLSSKTQLPHQTTSPSAQRPITTSTINQNNTVNQQLDLLLTRLQVLAKQLAEQQQNYNNIEFLPLAENLTNDYLIKNKMQLRQFYNALKRQQLHRQVSTKRKNITTMPYRTLSMGNLNHNHGITKTNQFKNHNIKNTVNTVEENKVENALTTTAKRQILPPQTLNLLNTIASTTTSATNTTTTITTNALTTSDLNKNQTKKITNIAKKRLNYNSCGTQTNFIPLQEIKELALIYKQNQLDNKLELSDNNKTTTGTTTATTNTLRKGSLENSDISPTVSDTIKRYLRMARKKSLTTATPTNTTDIEKLKKENKTNFQRINYDRQLRMIRARGEINPPGMDEDNSKAIQTLDAWPLIMLDFIRNNSSDNLDLAHNEWQQQLQERLQRKLDYELKLEQQQQQQQHNKKSPTENYYYNYNNDSDYRDYEELSSSATISPNSPPPQQVHHNSNSGGLLSGTTQFFSNLWHGNNNSTAGGSNSDNNNNNIQKSKFSPLFSKRCKYVYLILLFSCLLFFHSLSLSLSLFLSL